MKTAFGRVYLIFCTVNSKVYIGQTIRSIETRFKAHLQDSRSTSNTIISKAIRKHGAENFKIVCLYEAFSSEDLDRMEEKTIWMWNSTDSRFGYNKSTTATYRIPPHQRGRGMTGKKWSEQQRRNVVKALKGMKKPERGFSFPKGNKFGAGPKSEEHKEKIRQSMLKRKQKF